MIAIKNNGFYEIGHTFRCEINGDKVIAHNDMSWWALPIPIVKFEADFVEMSKEDYDLYIELCEKGEDKLSEAVLKKYVSL